MVNCLQIKWSCDWHNNSEQRGCCLKSLYRTFSLEGVHMVALSLSEEFKCLKHCFFSDTHIRT